MQTMDAPGKPLAYWVAFSVETGKRHWRCSWRGRQKRETIIGVYNVQTEEWTQPPITEPQQPGRWNGECAIVTNSLYWFAGSFCNFLELNLKTFCWREVNSKYCSFSEPMCKTGHGFIAVNERILVCFGGYGNKPVDAQPGSTFIEDIGSAGWTNELHLFDIIRGIITNRNSVLSYVCTACHDQLMLIHTCYQERMNQSMKLTLQVRLLWHSLLSMSWPYIAVKTVKHAMNNISPTSIIIKQESY